MKEWRRINQKLGAKIAASKDVDEIEKLQSQKITRKQARQRFRLESQIPSGLFMSLMERI